MTKEQLIAATGVEGVTIRFTYDANHNLTAVIGPRSGQHKEIVYDTANRPIKITDRQTDGTILTIQKKYNKMGHLIEEIDACNNSTRFEYDSLGRLVTTIHPDHAVEKKEYNVLNNIVKEIDAEGYETNKTYNIYGQVLSILHPDGTEENYSYDTIGRVHAYRDKNGVTTNYTYDIWDHVVKAEVSDETTQILKTTTSTYTPFVKQSETDAEGHTTSYTYDFSGRKLAQQTASKKITFSYNPFGLVETTDFQAYTQSEFYDTAGRLVKKTLGSQFEEQYAYDAASNQTDRITSKGTFKTHYNHQNQPIKETDPYWHTTHHLYNFGKTYQTTTIDANGVKTIQEYDSRGRVHTSTIENQNGEIIAKNSKSYDSKGNLKELTHDIYCGTKQTAHVVHHWEYGPNNRIERFIEASEKQTTYLYDNKGRLKTIIKPSGKELHHEYDSLGRLKRYFSKDFDYQYSYDKNDHVVSVYDTHSQTQTNRTYDPLGNIIQEILANDLELQNTFDEQGRRTTLTLPDQSTITFSYNGPFLHTITRKEHTLTYQQRDLEGKITRIKLPASLGFIDIDRDLLSRIATSHSPYFNLIFPEDAYDPVGNLLHYQFEDPLGKQDCRYTYSPLNQLCSENEHTYQCDSLQNRIEKDNRTHQVNNLCQILDDGIARYTYDTDGNLIFDGEWHYTYDSQNRLIALEKNNQQITYTYDPFHRRLTKTVFLEGKQTHHERYLWDGDNEIGSVEEEITQLRILGEGLSAEVGAAVLYELNSRTYLPLHDHRGNVVALIDLHTQQPVETYRYTAFGEENNDTHLSPWRFSSKRVEQESGLIFFGRRYYYPTLGRWITQDPEGYDDGPNLYAYLSHSPMATIDPYGLASYPSWSRHHHYNNNRNSRPGNWSFFENSFSNKSRPVDLRKDFSCDYPDPPVGGYSFVNGIRYSLDDWKNGGLQIAELSKYNVKGTYNATHSAFVDIYESIHNLLFYKNTPPVYEQLAAMNDYFDKDTSGAPYCAIATSHGTIIIRNTLMLLSEERRKRVVVEAFCPAAYINPKLCMKVTHYVCPDDIVPKLDVMHKDRYPETIVYVKKRPEDTMFSCHSFSNPIYLPHLKRAISKYQELLKPYIK